MRVLTTCLLLASGISSGAVRRVEITERVAIAGGYERVVGRVRFGVDPKLAANRIVRDLEFAQVNAAGEIEFVSDFYILKPVDRAKSNGTVLFEVSNRGRKSMLDRFAFARPDDFGDQWPMQQGYTLVWLGWEWDIPELPAANLHFTAPKFRADALPARGMVRSEFIPDKTVTSMNLADRIMTPIAVAKPRALYFRTAPDDPAKQVPATQWKLNAAGTAVEMPSGFEAGNLYEFVYEGKDPVIAGTGIAAVRDWISFLKYGGEETELSAESQHIKRAIGFGISQSGRFLRQFLYDGFNADEKGRTVFDGVWADVAGAGRGSFNFRYAQPSRDGRAFFNVFYPTDLFPFRDTELLERTRKANAVPKLFLTNNSYEYWGRAAAQIHITDDGKADAPLGPETRHYFIAGVQHGAGTLPIGKPGKYAGNPIDHRPVHRALLAALQSWLKDGTVPPASVYPKISAGQLTPRDRLKFPAIEGVTPPPHPRIARKLDFGPEFASKGIILQEPPIVRGAYPLLVPQVDADGNDLGGIRLPELSVPVATITGWNLRAPAIGAPNEMLDFTGSSFPFPRTKANRTATRDTRLSVEERYSGRDEYLKRVAAVTDDLVSKRFVLARDREYVIDRAAKLWDELAR